MPERKLLSFDDELHLLRVNQRAVGAADFKIQAAEALRAAGMIEAGTLVLKLEYVPSC